MTAMHKSRLAGFIIDCNTDNLAAATNFWSAALGMKIETEQSTPDQYLTLDADRRDMHVEVQRVSHPSRVHLDIESDDIEAEVARLEKLGAKRIEKIRTWVVMEAPTGQRFCVVRPQSDKFGASANEWK
jgi:predicted enzyme related to lactoylglutathione lyase